MVDVLFISSGEQFDGGLLDILCKIGLKVMLLNFARTDRAIVKDNVFKTLELPEHYIPYTFPLIQRISQKLGLKYVIVSRKVLTYILPSLFLSKVFLRRKHPIYILWYSPSLAYMFKALHFLRECKSSKDFVEILVKIILSIGFNIAAFLAHDYILVRELYTYRLSNYVNRRTFYIPPLIPKAYNFKEGKKVEPYILTTITLRREGVASIFESCYAKLAINLARLIPEIKFLVIGSSYDDFKKIVNDLPSNLLPLGKVYGKKYYRLVAYSYAILAYIELPGTSNRIAEAIAYGKPLITSKSALKFHLGLKHLHNCIVLDSVASSNIKHIIYNKDLLCNISNNIKMINEVYYRLAFKVFKQVFARTVPIQ